MISKNQSLWLRIVLSSFIAFHLVSIFILPNPESILYRKLSSTVVYYGNIFGFNTTWRFFSPNPLVRVLEYEVFFRDESGQLVSKEFQYPNLAKERFREIYGRKVCNSMFLLLREDSFNNVLAPKICSMHSEAETIAFYVHGYTLPTIESSVFQNEKISEMGQITRQHIKDVECKSVVKE